MSHEALRFFLFPHMTLSEGAFRGLSLLIPQLTLMRVLREPTFPGWSRDRILGCPLAFESTQLEQIRHSLKSFREFAALHEEHALMASLSRETLFREASESRFTIQSQLRGHRAEEADPGEKLLLEAALFLEMALDLDEKEKDLESDLTQAEGLEHEFRSILGIVSEDEVDEDLEPPGNPLLPDRGHLAFMLGQRMASWIRLYPKGHESGRLPVFVSVIPDALDGLVDRVLACRDRAGESIQIDAIPLGSLPDPARLPAELWRTASQKIQEEGRLTELWSYLHEIVLNPGDEKRLETFQKEIEAVAALLRTLCNRADRPHSDRIEVSLTHLRDVSFAELWQCLDRDGYEALSGSLPPMDFSCMFLGIY